jgi:hypothetical protein
LVGVTYEHKNEEIWQIVNQDEQVITKEDLQTALLKTKYGKSTGEDGINWELYKFAGDKLHNRLLKSFNDIYKNAQIPNEWNRSIIVPIYKKGCTRKPETMGELTCLKTCYKIFNKILN